MTTDETKSAYIDYMVKSLHAGDTNVQIKTEFETNNNSIRTSCSNNVNASELRMTPCSTNGELRLAPCSNASELRLATPCSNNGEIRLVPSGNNGELRLTPCSNASELRLPNSSELRLPNSSELRLPNTSEVKLTACSNTNGGLPSEFSIEYWNSPAGLGLSMEKDESSLWESSLLEDMNFFNAKMTAQDLEQHPESSTGEPCETTDSNHIIYTTLTSLSNDPSSPSISLDDTSAHSTSTPTWYHPPPSTGVDNSPPISTTSISSSSTPAQNKVPNIEDLDSFLNIIPADAGQAYATGYSESSTFEWKHDTGDPGGNLCEASTLWKTPSSEDNDSLLRNALEGKFKYANTTNNNNNEFVLTIKEENPALSNLVLDNQSISTIIYPIDSNSGQSIDEILQNINTHYEGSVDEFNNNNTGEYSKESIEIYYAIDNNINVSYAPSSNTITSSVPGSTAKKKKSKSKVHNHSSSNNNNDLINGKKERSLHYCEICNKGFKDKYSVNVHVRTHTGEKPFPCKICCKTFRQKAHLAKHFQTHLAPAPHSAKTAVTSSNKAKIMKT